MTELDRSCPTCDQPAGSPCISRTGIEANPPHSARRANPESLTGTGRKCPECGTTRLNPETLRVHRVLAHEINA